MTTYPDRPKLDYGYFVKRPPLGEGLKRLEKLSAWEPKVYSYVFHNCQTDKEINTIQLELTCGGIQSYTDQLKLAVLIHYHLVRKGGSSKH